MKKLDIIIASYNHFNYLDRCLSSLLNYAKPLSNLRVIIIDDDSKYKEERKNIVNKYSNYFECILLFNDKNLGPALTRNKGLELSNSEFIQFMDDDDEYCGNILEYCDSKFDIISTEFYPETPKDKMLITADLLCCNLPALIIKRDYLNRLNIKMPEILYGQEDSILRTCLFLCTTNINYIYKQCFYRHVYRTDSSFTLSITMGESNDNITLDLLDTTSYICNMYYEYINLIKNNIKDLNIKSYISFINILIFYLKLVASQMNNFIAYLVYPVLLMILKDFTSPLFMEQLLKYSSNIKSEDFINCGKIGLALERYSKIKNGLFYINCDKKFRFLIKSIWADKILSVYPKIICFDTDASLKLITDFYYKLGVRDFDKILMKDLFD